MNYHTYSAYIVLILSLMLPLMTRINVGVKMVKSYFTLNKFAVYCCSVLLLLSFHENIKKGAS